MSNSDEGGCLIGLLWIGTLLISIGSGILAWNWIEPTSFGGAIGFLIIWSIFSYIGHIIIGGIIALLGGMGN
ncbi:MAG: hypothetical protein IPI65_13615 [Bacteroidetes bacterium]|nr:hypothetical protein [Bacteroidota bacterium]